MLLLIDNYDSFTYNLLQYFSELGVDVRVFYHDAISLEQIASMAPDYLVISPGPGNPDQAGISLAAIAHFAGKIPLLGVCLGHQAMGQVFGGQVIHAKQIMHGKVSQIYHSGEGVFQGLPNPFIATRYHSLVINPSCVPSCLKIIAWTQDAEGNQDEIMGIQHRDCPVYGVQFHPESILTEQGKALLRNFLNYKARVGWLQNGKASGAEKALSHLTDVFK